MTDQTERRRLDEILLELELASETQIKIALKHQKIYGGKFGSHLMHHGFIEESGLVQALARQFDCEGAVISHLQISPRVLSLVPASLAIARKLIPFEYDEKTKGLKIACEDPTDQGLIDELEYMIPEVKVELYVAAEVSLLTLLGANYVAQSENLLASTTPTVPTPVQASPSETDNDSKERAEGERSQRSALLVSDDAELSPFIKVLLEQDDFEVIQTDSADDAIEVIKDRDFDAVFIKDTVSGDYLDLIDRLRKNSPRTRVRYYESATNLLLDSDSIHSEEALLTRNLELFTSLLSIKDKLAVNHSGQVGSYVDKLCRKMQLPAKDAMYITNAGYLHDIARFYYPSIREENYRTLINSTCGLLQSINYEPLVVEMLKSMYIDLKKKYTKRLPIEVLGGNILTIVDLFCSGDTASQKLTFDRFGPAKEKMRQLEGKLFLTEVVDAFVEMMEAEILHTESDGRFNQIMLYSDRLEGSYPIEVQLRNHGFRTVSSADIGRFVELFQRSKPDILILHCSSRPNEVRDLINQINQKGMDLETVPTFLLVGGDTVSGLTSILESGIDDIMDCDSSLDLLIMKLKKIRTRLEEQASQHAESSKESHGSNGRLADLSLVDLMNALGPSKRTTRITVTPEQAKGDTLQIYLKKGDLIHARLGALEGAEAMYEALTWTSGEWKVVPIHEEDLPEQNNHLPNESILMEGCRRLDESVRTS